MGRFAWRRRNSVGSALALAALAPCYLPGILGKLRIPPGIDERELRRFHIESDVAGLLSAVTFETAQLRPEAERLLLGATRDPLRKWLPLVRHTSHSAWSKLQGEALDCLWHRIGAEILLRAHEELAASAELEPLPDTSRASGRIPIHDRLGRTSDNVESLEQVLGTFGLSPHPRVLLLVEGETELIHFPLLLEQFGLDRPEQVRVQHCKGSSVNPQLLARYAISPRIGKRRGDGWQLAATPTALVIAMDAENLWATPKKRETQRKNIAEAIREQVELQGGQIGDTELDFLVNIHVWHDHLKYEFANFKDGELLSAITSLASGPKAKDAQSDAWQEETRQKLKAAQRQDGKIDSIIGPLRIKKSVLAEALWPVLLANCERELADNAIETPILKVILDVQRLEALLSAGTYVLPTSDLRSSYI